MAVARSRRHLWRGVPASHRQHGDRRGRLKSLEPVAESVRGATDRIPSARVSGPRGRAQRASSPAHAGQLHGVLPQKSHASRVGEGRARSPAGSTGLVGTNCRHSRGRRSPSPLRACRIGMSLSSHGFGVVSTTCSQQAEHCCAAHVQTSSSSIALCSSPFGTSRRMLCPNDRQGRHRPWMTAASVAGRVLANDKVRESPT
jgi:hypothetical protein